MKDTNWEFVDEANVKLYDLLVIITKQDALLKVECTHGEEQGFEAWRRLAHQHDPKGALSEIDRLNALTVVTKGTNMRDVLKKVEHWEQQWAKYEVESGDTLSLKLKTGVLLKMLPPKEEREIKLRYVDRPGELSYEVLRRQVENWIDNALDGNGPAPMDVGNLETADAIEALEAQLLVLRERKGKGKERGKGKAKGKGGKAKGKITTSAGASGVRQIKGNCWTCGETGHSAAQCTKRKGLSPCGKEEEEGVMRAGAREGI